MSDNLMQDLEDMFEAKSWPLLPDPATMSLHIATALTDKYDALDKKLEVLKFWLEAEKAKIEKQHEFIEKSCQGFMQNYMDKTGEKSLTLPNGHKLQFRKKQDTIEIQDEPKAVEWCLTNLVDACSIKTTVLKKPIMAHFKNTGEIVPGTAFIEAKELSFSIS